FWVPPNDGSVRGNGNSMSAGTVAGIVVGAVYVIILILGVLWWQGCLRHKDTNELELNDVTGSFTLRQIKTATNNFDDANKIGEGGFGSVYNGVLPDGTLIAVKQLSSNSRQGNREFLNELGVIFALQHPHLVKLHGHCIEGNQLLLAYEYMENNSLAQALFEVVSGMANVADRVKENLFVVRDRAYAPHSTSREYTLKTQLLRLKMHGDETPDAYLNRAQEYVDALAAIGEPVKDKDLVMLVVSGLREEYNGLKTTITARQSPTAFSELHALLSDHDYMLGKTRTPIAPYGPQAFYGARPSNNNRSNNNNNCGNRNNSRGNNNRGRDNGHQFDWASTQNTVYGTCNRCGIGHIPSQCPNRDPSTIRTRPSANFANTRAQSSNASANWHSDTGANSHVTPDLEAMDNSEAYYGDDALHVGNVVGYLTIVSLSRPDIAFAVNKVQHQAVALNNTGNIVELVDSRLGSEYDMQEMMVVINLALLCTTTSPTDRPTMSSVVGMLEGRIVPQSFVSEQSMSMTKMDREKMMKQLESTTESRIKEMSIPYTDSFMSAVDMIQ
ncbi:tryptophan synthase beta chain 1, partial [Tanacetum coccineum]